MTFSRPLFKTFLVLLFLLSQSSAWEEIALAEDSEQIETSYIDFSSELLLEFRLIQYQDAIDLDFDLVFQFFEDDSRSSYLGELMFNWNTKQDRQSIISIYESTSLSFCYASDPNILEIPQNGLIDLTAEHVVTIDSLYQGDYKDGCQQTQGWQNWEDITGRVQKLVVKLEDLRNSDNNFELRDRFTIEYRVLQPCTGGNYFFTDSCEPCLAGYYSAGGFADSCSECPEGTTVGTGLGISEADCVLASCDVGQYRDVDDGCLDCVGGTYSSGGAQAACLTCAAGSFSTAKSSECSPCPAGTYSSTNAESCTECIAGTYSEEGWSECQDCAVQYFSMQGSQSCCKCPAGQTSEEGSSTCHHCPSGATLTDDGTCSGSEAKYKHGFLFVGLLSLHQSLTLL